MSDLIICIRSIEVLSLRAPFLAFNLLFLLLNNPLM